MSSESAFRAPPLLDNLQPKGTDPILNLKTLFDSDIRSHKVNAAIGEISDDLGQIWTPLAVQIAKMRLAQKDLVSGANRGYLVPEGDLLWVGNDIFLRGTAKMIFGRYFEDLFNHDKLAAIGTIGASGGFSTIIDSLTAHYGDKIPPILMGTPHYGNHSLMMHNRKINFTTYNQVKDGEFDIDSAIEAIQKTNRGTIVLFHGGETHNPTGINPKTQEQWIQLAQATKAANSVALFDFPYIGLGKGIIEDTEAIRIFMDHEIPVVAIISYSKNAALYNQRTGALLIPTADKVSALNMAQLLNATLRNYVSSPASFGEEIMAEIFSDPDLMSEWENDLTYMSLLLKHRREIISSYLPENNAKIIREGVGIFSLLPISPDGAKYLREQYAIYILDNGRVNIGGVTENQLEHFGQGLKDALSQFPK
ncbi:aminotransferase class I/II-fold pyridoxal phosphate-dependent enzyme [Candidatus Gottesmanbacteria bacterium]|nr:aminotransferase class I/II-fold pyridoxal phosphate-dependent enzyme [Candidatus Gottesmanbacteria bacterium]